jgi:hypothetical protein
MLESLVIVMSWDNSVGKVSKSEQNGRFYSFIREDTYLVVAIRIQIYAT